MAIILWIIIIAIIVLIFWLIAIFNSLVKSKNRVKNAWSDIDVQLKRRYDLVPNLIEVVKGYKDYEANVLENVVKARASAVNAQGSGAEKMEAENMLSGALKNLFAVSENYPQLKASENFQKLQEQLVAIENDIQGARQYYNATVREFNNTAQTFPSSIAAGIFGFKPFVFFETEGSEKIPAKASF